MYLKSIGLIFVILTVLSIKAKSQSIQNFQLQNIENENVSYNEIKGDQLTIIDFWATWCKPCVKAMPALNQIYEEFSEKGVNVVGISCDGPRSVSKIKPLINSKGISYPILIDINSEVMQQYNYQAFPTLIIVDSKSNKVVFTHEGFFKGDEKLIREELASLLNIE